MQRKRFLSTIALAALLASASFSGASAKPDAPKKAAPIHAPAPAASAPPPAVGVDPKAIPDYGGRDSSPASSFEGAAGADAPSPLGQAWRAFEALVIVLALVFGGLYLLKRYGILEGGAAGKGGPAAAALRRMARQRLAAGAGVAPVTIEGDGGIQVLGVQPLPGSPGACVHLLSVAGRTILVGATAQSVTLISEWEEPDAAEDADVTPREFSDYLVRQGGPPPAPIEQDIVETSVSESNQRLREMLSRVRDEELETSAGKSES
ncbi:MAG: hypothetical protein JWQ02_3411 [Capsulimonas sp.]|nr:hypothetical protein [Capsulimonas sp.]